MSTAALSNNPLRQPFPRTDVASGRGELPSPSIGVAAAGPRIHVDAFSGTAAQGGIGAEPAAPNARISRPATDPATGGRPYFDQEGPACGTTSLSWALHQMGIEIPPSEIDKHIRPKNSGTAIDGMLDYSRGLGLQAQVYVGGDFETLQRELALGRQVLVSTSVDTYDANGDLVRGKGKDTGMHVMAISRAYVENGEQMVEYFNPWGQIETLPYKDFEKLWSHLTESGLPTGINRLYISIAKPTDPPLPPSNAQSINAILALSDGTADIGNGVAHLRSGNLIQGTGEILGGAIQTLGGALGLPAYAAGVALENGGRRLWDHAGEMLRDDGVLNKVGGVAVGAAGAIVTGVGMGLRTVGNGIATGFKVAGNAVEDAGRAVGNAVRDVGNAAKKLWKKLF